MIQSVKAVINGITHALIFNENTGKWEASIPAGAASSFNSDGGVFNVQLTAENSAGSSFTIDKTHASFGSALALKVIEKQPPVITIISPGTGAYITTATPTIKFKVLDNSIGNGGDSGVNLDNIDVRIDGDSVSDEITHEAIEGGYEFTCRLSALSEGNHILTIAAADNDGNNAAETSAEFKVDTVPPTLDITAPVDNAVYNTASIAVSGSTNDTTSTPVTVTVKVDDSEEITAQIGSDGSFSATVELAEGDNTIVITATDSAGKSSSITRTVTLDTTLPQFISVSLTPNPVDAGATLTLAVEVE